MQGLRGTSSGAQGELWVVTTTRLPVFPDGPAGSFDLSPVVFGQGLRLPRTGVGAGPVGSGRLRRKSGTAMNAATSATTALTVTAVEKPRTKAAWCSAVSVRANAPPAPNEVRIAPMIAMPSVSPGGLEGAEHGGRRAVPVYVGGAHRGRGGRRCDESDSGAGEGQPRHQAGDAGVHAEAGQSVECPGEQQHSQ